MTTATATHALEARALHKSYKRGRIVALAGIDLAVAEGEMFGLLGPNGAGKTTLVKILLGLRRPTQGEASLLGCPAGQASARRQVGYLPEDHQLPPYLTGRQAMDIYCRLQGESPRERRARMDELLDRVELLDRAGSKIRGYSKGMKQRLGLAQALLHEPRLVLLDEPTDGVDPAGRKLIRELIVEENARGATIFVNSHLLHEVEQLCNRVAILDQGQVIESGTIEELTARAAERANRVRFRFDGMPPALGERPGVTTVEVEEDALYLELDGDERIDELIDHLRANGARIRAIEPDKRDLETHFLEVIADRRAAREVS